MVVTPLFSAVLKVTLALAGRTLRLQADSALMQVDWFSLTPTLIVRNSIN